MASVVDSWADSSTGFSALEGTYFAEVQPDGLVCVDHCLISGATTLVDPQGNGTVISGLGLPVDLLWEIVERWGRP